MSKIRYAEQRKTLWILIVFYFYRNYEKQHTLMIERMLPGIFITLLGINLGSFVLNVIVICYIFCIYPFIFKKLKFYKGKNEK